jgi:hypothetical protein
VTLVFLRVDFLLTDSVILLSALTLWHDGIGQMGINPAFRCRPETRQASSNRQIDTASADQIYSLNCIRTLRQVLTDLDEVLFISFQSLR